MHLRHVAAFVFLAAGCSGNKPDGNGNPPSGRPDLSGPSQGPGSTDMAQSPPSQLPDFTMMPSPTGDMPSSSGDMAMGPPSNCDYPKDGYGIMEGQVLDPAKMYECYAPGGGDTTVMLSPRDLFDCDGKRGINGILLDFGGYECGSCEAMSEDMPKESMDGKWKEIGVRAVVVVAKPYTAQVGTIQDAKAWRDMFKLQDTAYVCAATKANFISYGFAPSAPVVDPRTMKFYFAPGAINFEDGPKKVVELANKNKK